MTERAGNFSGGVFGVPRFQLGRSPFSSSAMILSVTLL
jgi:hypothetical protein